MPWILHDKLFGVYCFVRHLTIRLKRLQRSYVDDTITKSINLLAAYTAYINTGVFSTRLRRSLSMQLAPLRNLLYGLLKDYVTNTEGWV